MKTCLLLLLLVAPLPAQTPGDKIAEAQAAHALALAQQKEGKIADAIVAFEKATTLDPTQPAYFSALGIALSERMRGANLVEQGRLAGRLRKAFAHSVELDPQHLPGLIGLTRFYANAPEIAGGSLERAKEFATRVRALQPLLGELELGRVAERGEAFSQALQHYEKAIALEPASATAALAAGQMLARLGRPGEARARFERVLQLDPTSAAARAALAALPAP